MRTFFCALLFFFCAATGWSNDQPANTAQLDVFYSPSCHVCQKAKKEFIPRLENTFPGRLHIQFRDLSDMEAYTYLLNLEERHSVVLENIPPIFYMNGRFLNGKGLDARALENFVRSSFAVRDMPPAGVPSVDLLARFRGFTPLIIAGAGLIDGINPCAFTVIVFFVSFLALQGYRKRELIVIGSLFICAVFITYFLLGVGVFEFLYSLRGFWRIVQTANVVIGSLSIGLGCLAFMDGIRFYRSGGKTDDLFLQLPFSIKKRIQKVIGIAYRKDGRANTARRNLILLGVSALVTGFLVSLLEAVCTGQTYLPTIAFVFKTTPLRFTAFAYLVLYNAMFIVPLLVIFVFALMGATSLQFSAFLRRHMLLIKFAMAVFFVGIGIFLLWRL